MKEVLVDLLGEDALRSEAGRQLFQQLLDGSVRLENLFRGGAIALPATVDDVAEN
jgi:hypothetical protein